MCYVHQMVIDNIRKVVGWVAIRLDNYLIVKHTIVKRYSTMNHILPFRGTKRYDHPDNTLFTLFGSLIYLTLWNMKAKPIVLCCLMFFATLL